MALFAAGLGPAPLLDQLETEEQPRRGGSCCWTSWSMPRRDAARALARARLEASLQTAASDFGRRNWIYLLRVIPRPTGDPAEVEIDAVSRFATPRNPAFLAKEALTHLGQTRHPRAADALVSLLGAWEAELDRDEMDEGTTRGGGPRHPRPRLRPPSRARAAEGPARARRPTPSPAGPELGAPSPASPSSGTQRPLLGPRRGRDAVARSGTACRAACWVGWWGARTRICPSSWAPSPAHARRSSARCSSDLRNRYAGQEVGKAAARALDAPPPASGSAPVAGHSGDLDPDGLPALLHRLAQGKANGTLNLLPREGGGAPATIGLSHGRPVSARWAHREGAEAVYHLFERPFAGNYAFDTAATRRPAAAPSRTSRRW